MARNHPFTIATLCLVAGSAFAQLPAPLELGLLPGDAAVGPAVNSQQEHSIARGGDQYLIAWSDYRGRSAGSQSQQGDGDVFGIRIAADGSPIDAFPFVIAGGMGLQDRPLVAWNGENWLVVYISQDPVGGYYDHQMRAVRVSPAGQVLDATPILFPPTQFTPSTIGMQLAGQSGQWLITRCIYHNDGYGTYLAGQRIGGNGQLLDTTPIMLIDWIYGQCKLLAANGEYLAAGPDWNNSTTTKARRIGTNGQPIGAAFTIPGLTLASNGSEYYVTWIADFTNIVGSRMTSSGTLLDPAGVLLFSDPSVSYYHTNLTHDGVNWWFEWGAASTLRTLRISATGNVLDPGGVQLPIGISGITQAYGVQLAGAAGGGLHVVWWDGRAALGGDANVFSLPISAENVAGAERCISTGTTNQRNPDLSAGPGTTSALAFVSEQANDDAVLVHFLNAAGDPTTSEPIEVYRGPNVGRVGIAFNGLVFMIAFDVGASGLTTTQIKARRMNPDGSFIDAEAFDVMPGFNVDVEALGDDFLVAAARFGTYPQNIYLFGNRIDGLSGAVLDGGGLYLGGWYVSGAPRVRTDGAQWLVAAHSMWSHDASQGDAILARVSAGGAINQAINPTPVAGGSGDLDIAWSGSKYLLVWRMNSLSNANNYIAGRIMNADGTFPPGYFTIAEAPGRQLRPTVSWDGETFVVAWEDQRNQASFFDARTDVYATRVTEGGAVLDNPAFAIRAATNAVATPALLSGPGGVTLIATSRFETTAAHDTYRVGMTRIGTPVLLGDANCDGSIDFFDIDPFVMAIFDPAAYAGLYCGGATTSVDCNADGSVDFFDIDPFLALLFPS